MKVSTYHGIGYTRGYICDRCGGKSAAQHRGGQLERWFCDKCEQDVCFSCHPKFKYHATGEPAVQSTTVLQGTALPVADVVGNAVMTLCVSEDGDLFFSGDGRTIGEDYVDRSGPPRCVSRYPSKMVVAQVAMDMGARHVLIRCRSGKVFAHGHNEFGERGSAAAWSSSDVISDPGMNKVSDLPPCVFVANRLHMSAAVTADGKVYRWGRMNQSDAPLTKPTRVKGLDTLHAAEIKLQLAGAVVLDVNDDLYLLPGHGVESQARKLFSAPVAKYSVASHHLVVLTTSGSVLTVGRDVEVLPWRLPGSDTDTSDTVASNETAVRSGKTGGGVRLATFPEAGQRTHLDEESTDTKVQGEDLSPMVLISGSHNTHEDLDGWTCRRCSCSYGPAESRWYTWLVWPGTNLCLRCEPVARVTCTKEHLCTFSNYSDAGYFGGWDCDNCGHHAGAQEARWHCRECWYDSCTRCHPPRAAAAEVTDRVIAGDAANNAPATDALLEFVDLLLQFTNIPIGTKHVGNGRTAPSRHATMLKVQTRFTETRHQLAQTPEPSNDDGEQLTKWRASRLDTTRKYLADTVKQLLGDAAKRKGVAFFLQTLLVLIDGYEFGSRRKTSAQRGLVCGAPAAQPHFHNRWNHTVPVNLTERLQTIMQCDDDVIVDVVAGESFSLFQTERGSFFGCGLLPSAPKVSAEPRVPKICLRQLRLGTNMPVRCLRPWSDNAGLFVLARSDSRSAAEVFDPSKVSICYSREAVALSCSDPLCTSRMLFRSFNQANAAHKPIDIWRPAPFEVHGMSLDGFSGTMWEFSRHRSAESANEGGDFVFEAFAVALRSSDCDKNGASENDQGVTRCAESLTPCALDLPLGRNRFLLHVKPLEIANTLAAGVHLLVRAAREGSSTVPRGTSRNRVCVSRGLGQHKQQSTRSISSTSFCGINVSVDHTVDVVGVGVSSCRGSGFSFGSSSSNSNAKGKIAIHACASGFGSHNRVLLHSFDVSPGAESICDVWFKKPVTLFAGRTYHFVLSERSGNYLGINGLREEVVVTSDKIDAGAPVTVRFSKSSPKFSNQRFDQMLPRLWITATCTDHNSSDEQLAASGSTEGRPPFAPTHMLLPPLTQASSVARTTWRGSKNHQCMTSTFLETFPAYLGHCKKILGAALKSSTPTLSDDQSFAVACVCFESLTTLLKSVPSTEWTGRTSGRGDTVLELRIRLQRFFWWACGLRPAHVAHAAVPPLTPDVNSNRPSTAAQDALESELRRCFGAAFEIIYPTWGLKRRCLTSCLNACKTRPNDQVSGFYFTMVLEALSKLDNVSALLHCSPNGQNSEFDFPCRSKNGKPAQRQILPEELAIFACHAQEGTPVASDVVLELRQPSTESGSGDTTIGTSSRSEVPAEGIEDWLSNLLHFLSISVLKPALQPAMYVPATVRMLNKMLSEISYSSAGVFGAKVRAAKLKTVKRFSSNNNVGWGYSGSRDSVCVTVSKQIYVHGLGLFGDQKGTTFRVDLCICEGPAYKAEAVIGETLGLSYSGSTPEPHICKFDKPVRLNAHTLYCLTVKISGSSSFSGSGSQNVVDTDDGVKFTFSSSSGNNNGTGTSGGQIPAVVYSLRSSSEGSDGKPQGAPVLVPQPWQFHIPSSHVDALSNKYGMILPGDVEFSRRRSKAAVAGLRESALDVASVDVGGSAVTHLSGEAVRKASPVPVAIVSTRAFPLYEVHQWTVRFLTQPGRSAGIGVCTPDTKLAMCCKVDAQESAPVDNGVAFILNHSGEFLCNGCVLSQDDKMRFGKGSSVQVTLDLRSFDITFVVNGKNTLVMNLGADLALHQVHQLLAVCTTHGNEVRGMQHNGQCLEPHQKLQRWELLSSFRVLHAAHPEYEAAMLRQKHLPLLHFTTRVVHEASQLLDGALARLQSSRTASADMKRSNESTEIMATLQSNYFIRELLPCCLVHVESLCESSDIVASLILPQTRVLEEKVKAILAFRDNEKVAAAEKVADMSQVCEVEQLSTNGVFEPVVVESDHPVKSPNRQVFSVTFPAHVQFLTLKFDWRCSFAHEHDTLSVFSEPLNTSSPRGSHTRTRTLFGTFQGRRFVDPSAEKGADPMQPKRYSEGSTWPAAGCVRSKLCGTDVAHDVPGDDVDDVVTSTLLLSGNRVVFEMDVSVFDKAGSPDPTESFGFRCHVQGHFVPPLRQHAFPHLQRELQHIIGLCCTKMAIGNNSTRTSNSDSSCDPNWSPSAPSLAADATPYREILGLKPFRRGLLMDNLLLISPSNSTPAGPLEMSGSAKTTSRIKRSASVSHSQLLATGPEGLLNYFSPAGLAPPLQLRSEAGGLGQASDHPNINDSDSRTQQKIQAAHNFIGRLLGADHMRGSMGAQDPAHIVVIFATLFLQTVAMGTQSEKKSEVRGGAGPSASKAGLPVAREPSRPNVAPTAKFVFQRLKQLELRSPASASQRSQPFSLSFCQLIVNTYCAERKFRVEDPMALSDDVVKWFVQHHHLFDLEHQVLFTDRVAACSEKGPFSAVRKSYTQFYLSLFQASNSVDKAAAGAEAKVQTPNARFVDTKDAGPAGSAAVQSFLTLQEARVKFAALLRDTSDISLLRLLPQVVGLFVALAWHCDAVQHLEQLECFLAKRANEIHILHPELARTSSNSDDNIDGSRMPLVFPDGIQSNSYLEATRIFSETFSRLAAVACEWFACSAALTSNVDNAAVSSDAVLLSDCAEYAKTGRWPTSMDFGHSSPHSDLGPDGMELLGGGHSATKRESSPINTNVQRFYYEVHILDTGPSDFELRCGFVSHSATPTFFDCSKGNVGSSSVSVPELVAADGDVIGCGYEKKDNRVYFTLNGLELGKRHDLKVASSFGSTTQTVKPQITLGKRTRVAVNFGSRPFFNRAEEVRREFMARMNTKDALGQPRDRLYHFPSSDEFPSTVESLERACSAFDRRRSKDHQPADIFVHYFSQITERRELPGFAEIHARVDLLLDCYPALAVSMKVPLGEDSRANARLLSADSPLSNMDTDKVASPSLPDDMLSKPSLRRQKSDPVPPTVAGKSTTTGSPEASNFTTASCENGDDEDTVSLPPPLRRSMSAPVAGSCISDGRQQLKSLRERQSGFLLDHAFWREKLKHALGEFSVVVLRFVFNRHDISNEATSAHGLRSVLRSRTAHARRCAAGYASLANSIEQAGEAYANFLEQFPHGGAPNHDDDHRGHGTSNQKELASVGPVLDSRAGTETLRIAAAALEDYFGYSNRLLKLDATFHRQGVPIPMSGHAAGQPFDGLPGALQKLLRQSWENLLQQVTRSLALVYDTSQALACVPGVPQETISPSFEALCHALDCWTLRFEPRDHQFIHSSEVFTMIRDYVRNAGSNPHAPQPSGGPQANDRHCGVAVQRLVQVVPVTDSLKEIFPDGCIRVTASSNAEQLELLLVDGTLLNMPYWSNQSQDTAPHIEFETLPVIPVVENIAAVVQSGGGNKDGFCKPNGNGGAGLEPDARNAQSSGFVRIREISMFFHKMGAAGGGLGGNNVNHVPTKISLMVADQDAILLEKDIPALLCEAGGTKEGAWVTLPVPDTCSATKFVVKFHGRQSVRVSGIRVLSDSFRPASGSANESKPISHECANSFFDNLLGHVVVPRRSAEIVSESALHVFQYLANVIFSGLAAEGGSADKGAVAAGDSEGTGADAFGGGGGSKDNPSDELAPLSPDSIGGGDGSEDELDQPSVRRQLSRQQSGLRRHVASLLFDNDDDCATVQLSSLQTALFDLLRDEMAAQVTLWDQSSQEYIYQLSSLLLGLTHSGAGLAYVLSHIKVVADTVKLFPVCSTEVQPQIVELCNRVLPALGRDDGHGRGILGELDSFLTAPIANKGGGTQGDDGPSEKNVLRTLVPAASSPGGTVLMSYLLSLLASSMQVQVRRRTKGKMRTEPLNVASHVLPSAPPVSRKVANKLLFLLKNLMASGDGSFEQLLASVFEQTIVRGASAFVQTFGPDAQAAQSHHNADAAIVAAAQTSNAAVSLFVSVAALCVLGADVTRLFSSWLSTDGNPGHNASPRPTAEDQAVHSGFCDYHGDKTTRAAFECAECGVVLCLECDKVRHLHPQRESHSRHPVASSSPTVIASPSNAVNASSDCVDTALLSAPVRAESKPTELKFNDGCVTCIAPGLRITVDIAKLHVHIDMKRETTADASSLAALSAFCRFCGVDLHPRAGDVAGSGGAKGVAHGENSTVCDDEECRAKMARACVQRLPCGHQCIGCRDEETCMPCVYGCQPDHGISAYDKCRICSAEDLCEGPCVQLECGHVFHYGCIEEKLRYRWELQGPRISFAFMNCPLCREPMRSPVIAPIVKPLLKLKETVEKMVLLRLEYENLANHDSLKKGGAFYKDKVGFGMHTFAYYECSKCSNPYYGGRHECADDLEADGGQKKWDRNELVCPKCLPFATVSECHIHGSDFIE